MNWIQIPKLNSNQQLDSNSIEEKWDTNWWRKYWKSSCEYGVGKKKTFKKTQIPKYLSMFLHLNKNSNLELFNLWRSMKYKIVLPKPTLMNQHNWNYFCSFFSKNQLMVINTIKYTFHIGYNHSLKQMLANLNLMSDNIQCFRYNYFSKLDEFFGV